MANQKEIRTRIVSVKNTQKITRAMKMVAGARLNRAQARIIELRPFAEETAKVLRAVVGAARTDGSNAEMAVEMQEHPLLAQREQKSVAMLVLTSDRGLCGAFNSSLLRQANTRWKQLEAEGKAVKIYVIGRKGRDYFNRCNAPVAQYFDGVWEDIGMDQSRRVAQSLVHPFAKREVDTILVMYNEFKSAMTQVAVEKQLFPLQSASAQEVSTAASDESSAGAVAAREYIYEPDKNALLDALVPIYIEITLLRALLESRASELGAQMTAMDSATKNAKDMIAALTLKYNRARQAAITTELMEIIGGAEALNN